MSLLNLAVADSAAAEADPLMHYGAGLLGFRHVTLMMVLVFFLLSVLSVPLTFIYSNGGHVVDQSIANSLFGIYTLGNMG
jgi:hypothetical protein